MKPNWCLHSPPRVNLEVQVRSDGIGIHKGQIPQAFLMGSEGAKLGNRNSYGVELWIITKLQSFEKSKQLQILPSPPRWSMTKRTLGEVETKQKQIRLRTWLDLALNPLCVLSTTMEFLVRIQEEQLWKLHAHVTVLYQFCRYRAIPVLRVHMW